MKMKQSWIIVWEAVQLVACVNTNKGEFIGIELDKTYFDIARKE